MKAFLALIFLLVGCKTITKDGKEYYEVEVPTTGTGGPLGVLFGAIAFASPQAFEDSIVVNGMTNAERKRKGIKPVPVKREGKMVPMSDYGIPCLDPNLPCDWGGLTEADRRHILERRKQRDNNPLKR